MNEMALTVNGVSLKLKKRTILDNINFEIPRGSVLGIVGHNGAGKTSLFHLLLGLKFQTAGEITLFGKSNLDHHSRAQLGYVPERPYLNLDSHFEDFLIYHANLMGIARSERANAVLSAAKLVGLDAYLPNELSTFSKGMLQKALIAQATLGQPDLLILDEPMSGLDPEARESVRQLIFALKTQGKTLIFSSHALEDVAQLADQVLMIDSGKIKFMGSVAAWKDAR